MNEREAKNLIARLMDSAVKKQRTCLFDGCGENSISSHLLQKNGILSQIAEDNHVYSYSTNVYTGESKFKRTGVNEAFTFQGYCGKHDDTLFKVIETTEPDFNSTTNKLLFTFRAIYNELRKKEIVNDGISKVIRAATLNDLIDKDILREFVEQNNLGIRDLNYFLDLAHKNYQDGLGDFTFSSLSLPRLPLCISTIISVESDVEMILQSLTNEKQFKEKIIPALIVNCFPFKQESKMLIAYLTKDSGRVEQFLKDHVNEIANDSTLKPLSDFIIKFSETWTCSPAFYRSNIQPKEKDIAKYSWETAHENSHLKIPFNIFD